jgi:pSer/pThr/pTyr-binding forkhead associated (FHA) protein
VVKHSKSISGIHARIAVHPRKAHTAKLHDLNSLNGTFVNETRVHHGYVP